MERCSPHGNLATPPFKDRDPQRNSQLYPTFLSSSSSPLSPLSNLSSLFLLSSIVTFFSSSLLSPPLIIFFLLLPLLHVFFLSSFCARLFSSPLYFFSTLRFLFTILFSSSFLVFLFSTSYNFWFFSFLISSLILPTHPPFSFYLPSPLFMSFIPHSFLLCSLHSCSVLPSPSFSLSCYSSSSHSLLSRTTECVLDLQALRRALQSPRRCSVSGMRHWPLTLLSAACEGWQEPPGCSAPQGVQWDKRGGGGGRQAEIFHTHVGAVPLRAEQGILFEVWICLVSFAFLDSSQTFCRRCCCCCRGWTD